MDSNRDWAREQEALYNGALARCKAADWKVAALSQSDRELVALWRMEADINNGGFLQFFGNWGEANCAVALGALALIGAHAMERLLAEMVSVVAHYGETEEVISYSDLPRLLTKEEHARLEVLEKQFWSYPDALDVLVVTHYG